MKDDHLRTTPQKRIAHDEPGEMREYRVGRHHVGETLFDRFKIFGLREGGFSRVFLVTDLRTQQEYAVKTYLEEYK